MKIYREDETDDTPPDPRTQEQTSPRDSRLGPCPHCGGLIYADAARCPHCDHTFRRRIQQESSRRPPLWVIIGAILALLAVLKWMLF